jgi:hypothetical protein
VSVIVAVRDPDGARVHLAADSAAVSDSDLVVQAEKLAAIAGPRRVVVGCAGWFAWIPMVVDAVAGHAVPVDDRDLDHWTRTVAGAATRAGIAAQLVEDGTGRLDGEALLAVGGRVWELGHHRALPVRGRYAACGTGQAVALGALHQLHRTQIGDPASWAEQAVEAAIAHVCTVAGPITAATT